MFMGIYIHSHIHIPMCTSIRIVLCSSVWSNTNAVSYFEISNLWASTHSFEALVYNINPWALTILAICRIEAIRKALYISLSIYRYISQVPPSIAAKIATSSRWKRSTLASTSRIFIMLSHSWFLCSLIVGQSIMLRTGVYRYCWPHFPQTAGWLNLGMVINFAEYRTHDFSWTWFFASLYSACGLQPRITKAANGQSVLTRILFVHISISCARTATLRTANHCCLFGKAAPVT